MTERTLDPGRLAEWVGRSRSSHDELRPAWASQMAATLGVEQPAPGDPLAPLWHWIFFHEAVAEGDLGPEGHEELGRFLPPVDLDRRMWAGGRVAFDAPIRIGDEVTKTSTVTEVNLKEGRSGSLCFVTVRHEITANGAVAITEDQDIVYRRKPETNASAPDPIDPPAGGMWEQTVTPSEVMLFRYSALTFNSHRIHYDRDYCRDIEGYPGLIFHGPLAATLLAHLAETGTGQELATFAFRAMAPLFDLAPFTIHGAPTTDGADVWAATPDGALAMRAETTLR